MLGQSHQFFSLPADVKKEIACARGPHPQRGWSCVGSEQTSKLRRENIAGRDDVDKLTDEREHFDAGPLEDGLYPNRWPDARALPGFRESLSRHYRCCQHVSLQIIAAIEVGLGLPAGSLVDRCRQDASEIRLNHYPPVSRARLAGGHVKRTWPHTDFGIITLLFQDGVGGLELEDRARPGTFVPVAPAPRGAPTEMVVNISDTFQRWTNGVIKAGVHQVAPPPACRSSDDDNDSVLPERHSCVFFAKASRATSVGPLPWFVSAERPAQYDEITALEFQQRMTSQLY